MGSATDPANVCGAWAEVTKGEHNRLHWAALVDPWGSRRLIQPIADPEYKGESVRLPTLSNLISLIWTCLVFAGICSHMLGMAAR